MTPQQETSRTGVTPTPAPSASPMVPTKSAKPVALVTGANQGIGLQIAKDLVGHGFTVLVGSRNFERGQAAAQQIGADAIALQLDVTDRGSIAAAAARVPPRAGPPRRADSERGHL